MSEKSLRVGIAGCGAVAQQYHVPAMRRIKGAKIVALCDVNEDLAISVGKRFNIRRYYADFTEMLKNEEVNLVSICTPPRTHATMSIQAMEAGCHVLIEKPMSVSCGEADDMIVAARSNRVKLCVVHNRLFAPVIMKAMSLVSVGVLGDLTGVEILTGRPQDSVSSMNRDHWCNELPGGWLGESLPHSIYLATAFLGNLEAAAVNTRKLHGPDWLVADEVRIILEAEKGMATITASHNWPKFRTTLDAFGTKRSLHVDIYSSVLTRYGFGGGSRPRRALDSLSDGYQQFACTAFNALNTVLGKRPSHHHVLISKFVDAIRHDTQVPVTGEDGREVVRVLERIASLMAGEPGGG